MATLWDSSRDWPRQGDDTLLQGTARDTGTEKDRDALSTAYVHEGAKDNDNDDDDGDDDDDYDDNDDSTTHHGLVSSFSMVLELQNCRDISS